MVIGSFLIIEYDKKYICHSTHTAHEIYNYILLINSHFTGRMQVRKLSNPQMSKEPDEKKRNKAFHVISMAYYYYWIMDVLHF